MNRNKFLKSFGLIGLATFLNPVKAATPALQKILKQVKPFNKETVTQKVAAEIMALAAWNHLNEKRFANTFSIKNEYKLVGKDGGTLICSDSEKEYLKKTYPHYDLVNNGVEIYSPTTEQYVRVWADGDWNCTIRTQQGRFKDSEYKRFTRNMKTGEESEEFIRDSGNGLNQVKMIELYLKLGFYEYT